MQFDPGFRTALTLASHGACKMAPKAFARHLAERPGRGGPVRPFSPAPVAHTRALLQRQDEARRREAELMRRAGCSYGSTWSLRISDWMGTRRPSCMGLRFDLRWPRPLQTALRISLWPGRKLPWGNSSSGQA